MKSLASMAPSKSKGISKLLLVGVLAVVIVIAAGAGGAMLGSRASTFTNTGTIKTPASVQVTAPSGVGSNRSLNFVPSTIKVVIGVNSTVVWVNHDTTQHLVQSTSVPTGAISFDSGALNPGMSFSITLTIPGTYHYHCEFHPAWMQGTIVVVQG